MAEPARADRVPPRAIGGTVGRVDLQRAEETLMTRRPYGVLPPRDVFGNGPVVVGHRGLGCGVVSGHRENTLASFTSAVALEVGWVEADVRRTRDDVLVVEHDEAYPDGTRLADVPVAEADLRGTLRLQALREQLDPDVGLDLDLKSCIEDSLREPARTTAGLLSPGVAAEFRRRRPAGSSFAPAALTRLRGVHPVSRWPG